MSRAAINRIVILATPALLLALGGCEVGHKVTEQTGYRGAGLDQIVDASHVAKAAVIPAPPYALPDDSGPRASATYQNVKVLGDVSTERFNYMMASITQWVAPPAEGCNYCHNPANMASDEKYTKIVARRMLQMTRAVNSRWVSHVKETGVTCYTCHRGNAVPNYKWASAEGTPDDPNTIVGNKHGQNTPDPNVGYASLPNDPFDRYFTAATDIRVAGKSAYPPATRVAGIKETEATYGLMMHISTSLGVNCTYCHNTQSLGAWPLSRQQRATAYYGIRMVRDIDENYISPLKDVFPAYRKGPHGDPYKVNCMTCHQGLSKPLGGVSMLKDYPPLKGPPMASAQAEGDAATLVRFRNPTTLTTAPAEPKPASPNP
ncbi:photosynthetic reaction center cytochrome c subunit [Sphingomonas koreensis]|nr:photosynthetic reaction center cytochrome c subunit [Sphingomonas koreensis]TPG38282.1 photosynthetic reaction center cytochrome c subunit [Sphingomonas koreensis]